MLLNNFASFPQRSPEEGDEICTVLQVITNINNDPNNLAYLDWERNLINDVIIALITVLLCLKLVTGKCLIR